MEVSYSHNSPNHPVKHSSQFDQHSACEAGFNNRKISAPQIDTQKTKQIKADKNTWSAIKNIPKNISIYCRAIIRVAKFGWYYIKHEVLKQTITPADFESCLRSLGPVISDFAGSKAFDIITQNLRLTPEEKNAYKQAMARSDREFNKPLSNDEAHRILKRSFGDKYKIIAYLETTQHSSCFSVEYEGIEYIAKVTSSNHLDEIAIGTRAMKMMALFSSSISDYFSAQTLNAFYWKNSLISEQYFHKKFHNTIALNPEVSRFKYSDNEVKLSLHIPEVIEPSISKNAMIVANVEFGYTINELSGSDEKSESLRSHQFRQCFGRDPVGNESLELIHHIHNSLKNKWMELAHSYGLVHFHFNTNNLVLSFRPGGNIQASIMDMGNCIEFPEHARKVISEMHRLVSAINIYNLDESEDFINDQHLQNLFTFFENQLQTESAKQRFHAKKAKIMRFMGLAFRSLRGPTMAGKDSSVNPSGFTPDMFGIACTIAKFHGVELPANIAIYSLALICLRGIRYRRT